MSGYVFRIREQHPQHWEHAKDEGYWEFKIPHKIAPGETCYFIVNKTALVGRGIAASGRLDTPVGDHIWDDEERYPNRVLLTQMEDYLGPPITPKEIEGLIGRNLNQRSSSVLTAAEDLILKKLFGGASTRRDDIQDAPELDLEYEDLSDSDLEEFTTDRRDVTQVGIYLRRGQPAFRKSLLEAYDSTCAVTGSKVLSVLEAAHISPFKGAHTNVVTNGMLLRSDIHTLFDLFHLSVRADWSIELAPHLRQTEYEKFHGKRLALVPARSDLQPRGDLLEAHHETFVKAGTAANSDALQSGRNAPSALPSQDRSGRIPFRSCPAPRGD